MSDSRFSTRTIAGTDDDLQVWDEASGLVIIAAADEAAKIVASLEKADAERAENAFESVDEDGYTVTVTGDSASVHVEVPDVTEQLREIDVADAERTAAAERDAALRETLQDFAKWPTKPQTLALEALVAAHGAVKTTRVSAGGDEFDYLRVTWGSLAYAPEGGALLDALGDLVQPSDPQTITVGLPLDTLASVLGRDTLIGYLEALRESAQAKGEREVSAYAVDTPIAEAVIKALRDAAALRARTVEFLAVLEDRHRFTNDEADTARDLLAALLPA